MSVEPRLDKQEVRAIVISISILALGFLVLWIAKSVMKIEGDAVFVSLLFVPLLVCVILSGKLEELKGSDGLETKFAKTASESITVASEKV